MKQFPITKPILDFISRYFLKPQRFLVLKPGKGGWQQLLYTPQEDLRLVFQQALAADEFVVVDVNLD